MNQVAELVSSDSRSRKRWDASGSESCKYCSTISRRLGTTTRSTAARLQHPKTFLGYIERFRPREVFKSVGRVNEADGFILEWQPLLHIAAVDIIWPI